ncbi:MAG TPA: HIT domain-containing protein, partial [Chloroflexia bacterium]|nr:HIT domain-containing protein [Chloroflexia bacterium]
MDTCVFCKLAKGQLRADIVYEDNTVLAFKDIHPQAPVHVLVIP